MSIEQSLKRLEDAKWFSGKGMIQDKYVRTADAILANAGKANWDNIPGHVRRQEQDLEVQTKLELEGLNLEVAQESLERFLGLMEQEAGAEVAEALMQIEVQKRELLMALDVEFAEARAPHEQRLEDLAQLMIRQDLRALAIIAAKTTHEIEIQKLRRQAVTAESSTFDTERQVLAKKIEVAQTKLRMIPEIEATLDAQRAVLDAERELIPLYEEQVDKEAALTALLEDTIPLLYDKSAVALELANKIKAMIPKYRELLEWKRKSAVARGDAAKESDLERRSSFTDEQLRDALQDLENEGRKIRLEGSEALSKLGADISGQVRTAKSSADSAETSAITLRQADDSEASEHISMYRKSLLVRSAEEDARNQADTIRAIAEIRARTSEETAEIGAEARIESTLIHAIS